MSSAKTIAKSTGFLFSTEIVDKLISFLLVVIITRYLGDVGYGKYSFAFAFITLFTTISNLGLTTYIFREIAKDKSKSKRLIDNAITLRFSVTILMFVIANIITLYWPIAREIVIAILLVEVSLLFDMFNQTVRIVCNAYEKNKYTLYSISIEKGLSLLFGAYALIIGYKLNGLLIALIIARMITSIFSYILMYKKFVPVSFSINFKLWPTLIKNSLPFWLVLVFQRTYHHVDTVMLSGMKDYAVTGWYNAATTLTLALTFIPTIIINATFPAMSRFYHTNSKDFLKLLYKKSFYYLTSLGIPISIGIALLAQRIILFIYKEQFIESGITLQILSFSLFFVFVTLIMGYLLNSINKQHLFTISIAICALSNVIINFILIPKFSYIGASIAAVITQFVNFCLLHYFTTKNGYPLNLIKISYKPVIAGAAMGILIIYTNFLPIIYLMPIAALFYFIILFLIGGLEKEEIILIKSFFIRKS